MHISRISRSFCELWVRYPVYNPKPSYAEEREQQGRHEEEGVLAKEG